MTKKNTLIALPVFMSFFIMGFVDIVGISTIYVKDDFNLSNTMAQMLPMMIFVWFALLSLPVGVFQDKFGKKNTLNIGIIISAVALIIPFLIYTYITTLAAFLLIGIGNTIIQVSANPLLHDVSTKKNYSSNMSLSQFIKAIASLLGPIIATFVAAKYGNWRLIFIIYSATTILSVIWLKAVSIPETKYDREHATFKSCLDLLKNKYIIITVVGTLACVGIDVGMNTNIALFLKSQFKLTTEAASIGIKLYFGTLIVARFFGAMILRKLNPKKFAISSTIFSMIGFVGIFFAPTLLISEICIVIIALGTANIFPVIFAMAIEKMPDRSNEVSGLIIMSVCGGAIFPPIMGILSDSFGAAMSLTVFLVCIVYILFATIYASKKA